MENNTIETKYNKLITILSVVIPVAVAALFGVSFKKLGIDVEPFTFLPPIYASINALTALLLVVAVIAIKNGNRKLHEILMKLAIACSVAFLLMYVAYHMSSESTKYLGEYKMVYYFILISHILLSIAIIPLVLITYVKALAQRFDKHKKIAKITFPIWLYVAVTGVIVYLMISPFYAN
jgi:putative membrane protein